MFSILSVNVRENILGRKTSSGCWRKKRKSSLICAILRELPLHWEAQYSIHRIKESPNRHRWKNHIRITKSKSWILLTYCFFQAIIEKKPPFSLFCCKGITTVLVCVILHLNWIQCQVKCTFSVHIYYYFPKINSHDWMAILKHSKHCPRY